MKTRPDRAPRDPKKLATDRGVLFRRGQWWVRWVCTEGHDHRRPSGASKAQAKAEYQALALAVRQARQRSVACCSQLDKAAARPKAVVVGDLIADYAEHSRRTKRSHATDRSRLPRIQKAFGGLLVDAVTPKAIEDWREALRAEGRSPTTANHYVRLLKAIFGRAIAHGRIAGNPAARVKLLPEPPGRIRYLTEDEERRLFAVLPPLLVPVVTFTLLTGLRRGEVLGMTWAMVDLPTATVHRPQTKTGAKSVRLHPAAVEVLRQQRAKALVSVYCFSSIEGKRMRNFERYWRPALHAAGLVGSFRFHDTRHTWASRLAMAGVDLYQIQKLGGWAGPAMVQRYAHLSDAHLRAALAKLPVPCAAGPADLQCGGACA
jgi:integrase